MNKAHGTIKKKISSNFFKKTKGKTHDLSYTHRQLSTKCRRHCKTYKRRLVFVFFTLMTYKRRNRDVCIRMQYKR